MTLSANRRLHFISNFINTHRVTFNSSFVHTIVVTGTTSVNTWTVEEFGSLKCVGFTLRPQEKRRQRPLVYVTIYKYNREL